MSRKAVGYLIALVLVVVSAMVLYFEATAPKRTIYIDNEAVEDAVAYGDAALTPAMPVIISDERVTHILYGDERGGGHMHGVGKPCKSEFPQSWDDEKIIDVTRKIAANDNLDWERQKNGYYVTEEFEGNIEVRVVKGPQKLRVITAYPVNVPRNPCPL